MPSLDFSNLHLHTLKHFLRPSQLTSTLNLFFSFRYLQDTGGGLLREVPTKQIPLNKEIVKSYIETSLVCLSFSV